MRITAKTKDCRLWVSVKASGNECFDAKEVDRFSRAYLRCYLKPQLFKPNLIEYSGPTGISLQDRMNKEITKRDFLFILEHIVVAVQKLRGNNFPIYHLKMDMQHIFINEATKELQFLYVPTVEVVEGANLIELFAKVISAARPAQEQDVGYVARFHYFFKSLRPFDINKVEQFILQEDRSVVNTIKKQNAGQSGFMTSNHKRYYDYLDEQEKKNAEQQADEDPTGLLVEEEDPTGLLIEEEDPTGLLVEEEDPTGLLVEEEDPTGLLVENEESTGLLYEANPPVNNGFVGVPAMDEATGLLTETEEEATGLLNEQEENGSLNFEDEATGLLIEEEENGTALLVEPPQQEQVITFPELHRMMTGEIIKINKPVFRIGKERSYVDYFIANNNAVSRSHADIVTRENGYFVVDLNSKNRTYINNVPLVVQRETPICNGDILRLANEEFRFYIGTAAAAVPICPNCKRQVRRTANFCTFCGHKI